MHRLLAGFLLVTTAVQPSVVIATDVSVKTASAALEEIVVTGRRPGPPLWKISSDEGVLWIFGTLTPLPNSFDWNSDSIERIISQATTVILPPNIGARSSNPFAVISVMSKFKKLGKNPDGKSLD